MFAKPTRIFLVAQPNLKYITSIMSTSTQEEKKNENKKINI